MSHSQGWTVQPNREYEKMKNEYLAVWEGELLQVNSPPFSMDSIAYRKGFVKRFEEVFEIFF